MGEIRSRPVVGCLLFSDRFMSVRTFRNVLKANHLLDNTS